MWKPKTLLSCLESYVNSPYINKIIVVDNDYRNRPIHPILSHEKIELVNYGKNIYVNPAWNEGYYRTTTSVFGLLNDDIIVNPSLFEDIATTSFEDIDLVGVHLQGTTDNYHITDHQDKTDRLFKLSVNKQEAIGGQSYAFGVCMFIRRSWYTPIPSLYQIWFGDDYLVQKATNIYCLKTSKIKGEISKTLVELQDNKEISDRIVLDCINASTYGHLKHSKNWDLVRQTVDRSKMKFTSPVKKNPLLTEYERAKKTISDINENLHILYELAQTCNHVTEMGVRTGVSTRAFLATNCELVSYDTVLNDQVTQLFNLAKSTGKQVKYIKANTLELSIEPTDLLFIDTLHNYSQLKKELELHGNKSRKYLAFHDTHTFGLKGETDRDTRGLLSAVIEFVIQNPQWRFKIYKTNNNGMTVLERVENV